MSVWSAIWPVLFVLLDLRLGVGRSWTLLEGVLVAPSATKSSA
jgi:hypothetical protein